MIISIITVVIGVHFSHLISARDRYSIPGRSSYFSPKRPEKIWDFPRAVAIGHGRKAAGV